MASKTLDKGLDLIELLVSSSGPRGVTELGHALGEPKTNVFRLLETLVARGYVRQRPGQTGYELTLRLWELGSVSMAQRGLPDTARPLLEQLAAETGESAQLAILDGRESVYIDKKDGPHPVRGVTRIGSRLPAHCCATGKAELAFRERRDPAWADAPLPGYTRQTLTSAEALEREFERTRQRGFAVNRGEWFEDVWGVAAPIRDRNGSVCASIGVWGPKHRLEPQFDAAARAVVAAADSISTALGFGGALAIKASNRRSAR